MKKIILIFSIAFCFLKMATVFSAPLQLPMEFTVSQRWLSWSSDFDIDTPDYKLGYVHCKVLSLLTQYDFYDNNDVLKAKGVMRWFSWGATFDVSDAQDALIGRVEERVLNFLPTFEIISPANNILAVAKLNVLGTTYTFTDPVSQREIATLQRSFWALKDDWTMKITDPELFATKQIDPRLFILVAVFQSDSDVQAAYDMLNSGVYNRP